MTVPKYVEDKMRRAHHHFRKGNALMADVNEWFDAHGFDAYELRDGGGNSLEEIEYGTDNAVDNFLKMLETMDGGEDK